MSRDRRRRGGRLSDQARGPTCLTSTDESATGGADVRQGPFSADVGTMARRSGGSLRLGRPRGRGRAGGARPVHPTGPQHPCSPARHHRPALPPTARCSMLRTLGVHCYRLRGSRTTSTTRSGARPGRPMILGQVPRRGQPHSCSSRSRAEGSSQRTGETC
jgi:hypothetical protein